MPASATRSRRSRPLSESPIKSSVPRHCRRCPDEPLLIECVHTASGREYLARQAEVQNALPKQSSSRRCQRCPNRPYRSQCIHTKGGREFLREQEILKRLNDSLDVPHEMPPTSLTLPPLPPPPPPPPPTSMLATSSGPQFDIPGSESAPYGPDDFQLYGQEVFLPHPGSSAPSTPLRPPRANSQVLRTQSGASAPITPSRSDAASHTPQLPASARSGASQSKRALSANASVRATKANPKHGHVTGCMRGNAVHNIYRKHARPEPADETKDNSKQFLEGFNRLVERCDDLGVSTGCWLFLGAQHAGGVGATLHYTSPRLLRDAPERMEDVASEYNNLMCDLLASRRSNAMAMAGKLSEAKEENRQLTAKLGEMEGVVLDLASKVQMYADRLGI